MQEYEHKLSNKGIQWDPTAWEEQLQMIMTQEL